ncbi:unnamed protein product [Tenebrio molitor]|nr:unnamed protein product [Tenebrio molitor]
MEAWKAWDEEHRTRCGEGARARRRTTPREDRLLRIMALRERLKIAVADQWYAAVGSPIHMRIVYHRVRSMGLTSYCPRLVLPLTSGMVQRM